MSKIILAMIAILAIFVLANAQSNKVESIVKGRVLDSDGLPVAGASVTASPTSPLKGLVPTAKTDIHGEFSVVVNQTGEFFVTAKSDDYMSTGNRFYYPNPATEALVKVVAGEPPPFATVRFGPFEGLLRIGLADVQTHEPIREAMINLCRADAPKYCHRFTSRDPRGSHGILVPDARFTIQISADGYDDAYGETLAQNGLQVMQISHDTRKQINIPMRKATGRREELPAPAIISPKDGMEFWDTPHPRNLKLEWSAVPGAKTYTVEVDICDWEQPDGGRCTGRQRPLEMWQLPPSSGIEDTKYEFVFPTSQPGRWRVWAVDANGRPGAKTPWTLFLYKSTPK